MSEDSRKISELVDAIVEETDVDWDHVIETAENDDERDLIRAVASLARIQAASDVGDRHDDAPVRWGTLDIVGRLGQGTFGTVYRARDPALHLDVALKVLKPDVIAGRTRILEEGRALARLRHPNIVRVYGADTRDDAIGLRMELLDGESLHGLVERDGPLGFHEVARIGIDLCRALSAVHAAGLVHRDVKAQNVMREPDGRIVLMDLGASTPHGDGARASRFGTPLYMAPELLAGKPAAPASDLFALGVLLYYLLSGTYPIQEADFTDIAAAHRLGHLRPIGECRSDVPAAFARVVERCLAARPEDRFQNARSVARALATARIGERSDESPPSTIRNNLPPQFTPFVGRERDTERITRSLARAPLVTLTGPGGAGKTRLALETGAALLDSFPGGVFVVELAGLLDEDRVAETVASAAALDIRNEDVLSGLVDRLAEADDATLLILDNCEHVLPGVRRVVDALLRHAPRVRILGTSREPLRAVGETTLEVPPLDLPTSDEADEARALESSAVRLFVDSATAARHDFVMTRANAPAVLDVCRRLDGLPLALELAGAAVRYVPIADIASRLRESFLVLDASPDTRVPHHRTLDTSIAWSYDMLPSTERRALEGLSVFCGGWTLDAAEAVLPRAFQIDESRVLKTLSRLVSKSLVQLHMNADGEARYRMLDTIRTFARGKLDLAGFGDDAQDVFLDFCIDLSERLGPELRRGSQRSALRRLLAEDENLHAALQIAIDRGDVRRGRRLAGAMGSYWLTRSRHAEGLRYCEAVLREDTNDPDTLDKARAAEWSGVFSKKLGDHDRGWSRTQQSLAMRRSLGDRRGEAGSLNSLGITCYERGDYDGAMSFYEDSLAIRRDIGDDLGVAQVLNNMGIIREAREEHDVALAHYEEALSIHRRLGNDWGVAMVLNSIGVVRANRNDHDGAREAFERSLDIHESLGDRWGVTVKRMNLGHLARWQKRFDDARRLFREAMTVQREIESRPGLVNSLLGMALIEAEDGDAVDAVRYLGRVDAILDEHGLTLQPDERREMEDVSRRLRDRLDPHIFERERSHGRELPLEIPSDD